MRKSDLKDRMVVETRDSYRYLVCGSKLIGADGWLNIKSIGDDLTNIRKDKEFDIVRVFDEVYSLDDIATTNTLIWERKETYKFNERQLEVLAPFRHGFGDWWLVKNSYGDDGEMILYEYEPIMNSSGKWSQMGFYKDIYYFNELFKDYDDTNKPIQIKDIFSAGKNT